MKEKPLILPGGAEMIRATLKGRKSRFTVPVKFPIKDPEFGCEIAGCELGGILRTSPNVCPFGAPGHRLWVRETWAAHFIYDDVSASLCTSGHEGNNYWYRADGENEPGSYGCTEAARGKWRSPIQMPRWASRITLEVVNVKVQRLQEITEDEAAK